MSTTPDATIPKFGGGMTKPIFSRGPSAAVPILPAKIPIETYKILVDQCAMHHLNYPIANGSPIHARILITKLFEISKVEVVIVTGALTDKSRTGHDVYGYEPVIQAAQKFLLNPDAQLSIILQEGEMQNGNENRFFRSIINDPKRCGVVTITTPKKDILDTAVPHFMISDQSSYRIETGTDAMDKTERMTAVANFGDQITAKDLRAYFDEVIEFISPEVSSAQSFGPEVRVE